MSCQISGATGSATLLAIAARPLLGLWRFPWRRAGSAGRYRSDSSSHGVSHCTPSG
ncbi:hypothetical protein I552_8151 [Mycobacterium xenopi 3993]|nr:hypothetical protein I552_8151 [Mycobacterium xenopi 3993]